jgi:16S rRNA G527 N7-methylase RsmG
MAKIKEVKQELNEQAVFVFVGDGAGVPGLPHRVTLAEAKTLGVEEILKAALANGNYKQEGA